MLASKKPKTKQNKKTLSGHWSLRPLHTDCKIDTFKKKNPTSRSVSHIYTLTPKLLSVSIFSGTGSIFCVFSHPSTSFNQLICRNCGLLYNVWFQYSSQQFKLDHRHPDIHLEAIRIISQLLYQQVKLSLLLSCF